MTSANTVYDCIVAVTADLAATGLAKRRVNQQQGYTFRGIDDVFNALAPLLAKHRLVVLPRVLARTVTERASKNGGVLFAVTVEVEFDFVSAADGSRHTVKTYGEAMDSGDKATNKALSAAYKYAALQTFCIPTEGDNDADAVTPEPVTDAVSRPAVPTQTMRVAVPIPPAGYAAWLDTLHTAAIGGTSQLERAWSDARKEYRQHLNATAPETQATLKAIAARRAA